MSTVRRGNRGLGRGLGNLIPGSSEEEKAKTGETGTPESSKKVLQLKQAEQNLQPRQQKPAQRLQRLRLIQKKQLQKQAQSLLQ